MADKTEDTSFRILGDINPKPEDLRNQSSDEQKIKKQDDEATGKEPEDDKFEHSGSDDVRTGGTGTVTGGTRNYRSGSGATGMDIGNRPE